MLYVIISKDGGDYGMGQYKVHKETFENYSLKIFWKRYYITKFIF